MAQAVAKITLDPIGYFNGTHKSKSAIPRQGTLSQQQGWIEFTQNFDSKKGLMGLEKMSHVWIIFQFHEAQSPAKAIVRPPRNPDIQVGVWATRSPYRPNSLGLTLGKIEKIEKNKLSLSQIDLLDQTPILDLKPYVTDCDLPQNPKLGWIDEVETWKYFFAKKALKQICWLKTNGLTEIEDVFESQFGTPPLQFKRKRVKAFNEIYILSYRTWRFFFKVNLEKKLSQILEIQSGYTESELQDFKNPYQDKQIHREFNIWNLKK